MEINNYVSLFTKKQWTKIQPVDDISVLSQVPFPAGHEPQYIPGKAKFVAYTQSEMLSEYYPSGHKINSTLYYPNVHRVVEEPEYDAQGNPVIDENGNQVVGMKHYEEMLPRHAFAFQQIIAAAHVYHATTNDLQHELAIDEPTEKDEKTFERICDGWIKDGMEEKWHEFYTAREHVAEAAIVGHISNIPTSYDDDGLPKTFKQYKSFRVLSFENGDQLFPQYDAQGSLILFGRLTQQYDENGSISDTLEVWDEQYLTTYRKGEGVEPRTAGPLRGIYGLAEEWQVVSRTTHGFPFIPVAYNRNDKGPGWWASQDLCDNYELTFSQMAHSNQAFGNSILVLKSSGEAVPNISRGLDGSIKTIYMGEKDEAKFLEGQSASDSYIRQLEKTEEMIYRCSNIVKSPNDLKSGDTPATAIKLLFTPNLIHCTADLAACRDAINQLWKMYAFAFGVCEKGESFTECMSLPVINYAVPYVPQSESAVTADLVALVGAKIISKQTAADRASFYSKPNEQKKILAEEKAADDQELVHEIKTIEAQRRLNPESNGGGGLYNVNSEGKRDGDGDGIYDE
ncbi:MAG: phage portal protein [Paludibacteraceae bacterium]|nr:phage portal protein [Paludibacteraceae bacterium]